MEMENHLSAFPITVQHHPETSLVNTLELGNLGHRRHHAPARLGLAQLPHLALDGRVAFGVLELLLEFAQRHFLLLVPLPVLKQVIGGGHELRVGLEPGGGGASKRYGSWRKLAT